VEEPSPKRSKKSVVTELDVVEVAVQQEETAVNDDDNNNNDYSTSNDNDNLTRGDQAMAVVHELPSATDAAPLAPTATATPTSTTHTTTVTNLRLPSHRTPGKHNDDLVPQPPQQHWAGATVRRVLGGVSSSRGPAPAAAVATNALQPALSFSTVPLPPPISTSTTNATTTTTQRRLLLGGTGAATESATTSRDPEPTTGEPMASSSPALPSPTMRTDPTSPLSLWHYTSTWFVLFLLLQVPFFSPILSTVVSASNVALELYQSALGPESSWLPLEAGAHNHSIALIVPEKAEHDEEEEDEEDMVADQEPVIHYQTVIQTILVPNEERQAVLQELHDVQQQFDQALDDFTRDLQRLEDEGREVERMQWHLGRAMEAALLQVDDQVTRLRHVIPLESEDNEQEVGKPVLTREPGAIRAVRDDLDEALRDYLLDLRFLHQWEGLPNRTTCEDGGDPFSKVSSVLSPSELDAFVEELVLDVAASAETVMKDDQIQQDVREWVRDEVMRRSASLLQQHTQVAPQIPDLAMTDSTAASGASLSEIESVIHNRLELERADQTGRVDYASIMNGATVIKSGHMATSPSLKDNLPFLNRLAAHTNHAFYGYGPEMALTPKNPPLKLGQCWSFAPGGNVNAQLGMLSFRLARPVRVDVVSIEHPPPDVTDQSSSAIRKFRVLGWETPRTTPLQQQQRPWLLGSFEYQIDGAVRQEFSLPETVEGTPVPRLHAMSLVIDSNWGMAAYSCLYRVRVFGRPDHDERPVVPSQRGSGDDAERE